jgi:hypothetical protein
VLIVDEDGPWPAGWGPSGISTPDGDHVAGQVRGADHGGPAGAAGADRAVAEGLSRVAQAAGPLDGLTMAMWTFDQRLLIPPLRSINPC